MTKEEKQVAGEVKKLLTEAKRQLKTLPRASGLRKLDAALNDVIKNLKPKGPGGIIPPC